MNVATSMQFADVAAMWVLLFGTLLLCAGLVAMSCRGGGRQ